MVIGDITEKIKTFVNSKNYGSGVYVLTYPAFYEDGTPVTVAVKLEQETDVVLERGEEAENLALLSTSDSYEIRDLGSVLERFNHVEGIEEIISSTCDKYHIKFENGLISLEADTETTLTKLNRYIKCIFEIELRASVSDSKVKDTQSNERTAKLMEYINRKSN